MTGGKVSAEEPPSEPSTIKRAEASEDLSSFAVQLGSETWWRRGLGYERAYEFDRDRLANEDGVLWLDYFKPRSHGRQPVYIYDLSPIKTRLEELGFEVRGEGSREPAALRLFDCLQSTRLGFHRQDSIAGLGVELADPRLVSAAGTYTGMRAVRVSMIALPKCIVTVRDRPEYWFGRPLDTSLRQQIRESWREPAQLEPFATRLTFQDPVQRSWLESEAASSSGTLAELVLLELSRTFQPACGDLLELLEGAEQTYFSIIDIDALTMDDQALWRAQRNFFELIGVLGSFARSLSGFAEGTSDSPAWFSDAGDRGVIKDVRRNYDEALSEVRVLRQDLRASVDMMASTLASKQLVVAHHQEQRAREQLRLAEEQRDRNERFMRDATLIASLVLLPTLIATIYGANVGLPFRDNAIGTVVLVVGMVVAAMLAWRLIHGRYPSG